MSGDCERLREVASELALGIADGEQRALAIEHLAICAKCRAHLERLAGTADELLLLAPAVEPPPGFEGRVAAALEPPPRSPWRRLATPAIAALAAAAAAAAVWLALDDDRDLADAYRETLAVANGEYFTAAPLEAPGGGWAGYVYGYQGSTSWVFVVLGDEAAGPGRRVELVTDGGERIELGRLALADGEAGAGFVTPVAFEELAEVRVLDRRGREVADSDLGS
jgi:hypothetical protein